MTGKPWFFAYTFLQGRIKQNKLKIFVYLLKWKLHAKIHLILSNLYFQDQIVTHNSFNNDDPHIYNIMETNLNTSHIPFGYKFTYSVKSFNKNPVFASNNLRYCSSLSFIFSREKHHLKQRQNKATFAVKLTKPRTLEIFMGCYCVARNKPIRREITKP